MMSDQSKYFYLDKKIIRRRFSGAASSYDRVAILQRTIVDRLIERLRIIKFHPTTILDVGSGTGYGAQQLSKVYRDARIVQLDIAPGMLRYAKKQIPWLDRLRKKNSFVCGDAERLPLANDSVDMIFSSLALQWCQNLDAAFAEFQRVLKPGGLLMFSSLGPDTLKELRRSWTAVDNHTHVSAFIDMHDVGDALSRNRFNTPVMDMEYLTLTYPQVGDLIRDLKQLGSRNATSGRAKGLTSKEKWQHMTQAYENFRTNGELPATYEIVYGHAWGNAQKLWENTTSKPFPIAIKVTK